MARAGFGDGLVPRGLVDEARLDARGYRTLTGVARQVALLTRKTVHQLAGFAALRDALVGAAAARAEAR
jgi:hypothetical protein